MSDDENFANYPVSIAEAKASRTPQGAELWKPRDALIAALRAIDSGEIDPTWLIIATATVDESLDKGTTMHYFQCIPNTFYGVGMMQAATLDYFNGRGA